MFRKFVSKAAFVDSITIIPKTVVGNVGHISSEIYDWFNREPSRSRLISVMLNPDIAPIDKRFLITAAQNISFNWSGIKTYCVKKRASSQDTKIINSVLAQVPESIELCSPEEARIIMKYITKKSHTQEYENYQLRTLVRLLQSQGVPIASRFDGHGDLPWKDDEKEHNADAIIWPYNFDKKIIVFARYGNCGGGGQNDRHSGIISTARDNPDMRFLFLSDGLEMLDQFPKYRTRLHLHKQTSLFKKFEQEDTAFDYSNSIWCSLKLLPYMDWENFVLDLEKQNLETPLQHVDVSSEYNELFKNRPERVEEVKKAAPPLFDPDHEYKEGELYTHPNGTVRAHTGKLRKAV